MHFHKFFLVVFSIFLPVVVTAQSNTWGGTSSLRKSSGDKVKNTKHKIKDFKERVEQWGMDTNYKHTFLAGGKLNTDGWSGSLCFLNKRSFKVNNVLQFSFSEIKHEKQVKQKGSAGSFSNLGNPSKYVYGKMNNLYTLQVGVGKENLILPALMEGNISISWRSVTGISLGMLKPYYLKLIYVDYTNGIETAHIEQHKYSLPDSAQFLNHSAIMGASSFTKSLLEVVYVPGLYFENALVIIPGKKAIIQVVTLGINGSIYYKKLPIMIDQPAYQWQACLFAGIAFGKRWR